MGVIGGGYFSGTEMVRAGAPEHATPVQFCAGLDALAYTGREIGRVELVEPPAGTSRLQFVAPALADAGQDEAARVVQRAGADSSRPASVVPGDADGDVVGRQAAGAGGKACHDEVPVDVMFRPAGGCFQSSALAPDTS